MDWPPHVHAGIPSSHSSMIEVQKYRGRAGGIFGLSNAKSRGMCVSAVCVSVRVKGDEEKPTGYTRLPFHSLR